MILSKDELNSVTKDTNKQKAMVDLLMINLTCCWAKRLNKYNCETNEVVERRILEGSHIKFKTVGLMVCE